jgi:hypothetical protein
MKEYLAGEIVLEEVGDNKVSIVPDAVDTSAIPSYLLNTDQLYDATVDAEKSDSEIDSIGQDDEPSPKPAKLDPKMSVFLTRIFENARPIDISQIKDAYVGGNNGSSPNAPVLQQLRDVARMLVFETIPEFIETLKDVINEHPENRIKKLIDNYGQNLEKALLAKNYDLNEQRKFLGKKVGNIENQKEIISNCINKRFGIEP